MSPAPPPSALPRRLTALAVVDGAGTGLHQGLVAVLLAHRFGLAAAGLLGVGYLGRVPALWAARRLERVHEPQALHRWFAVATWAMVLASAATLAAAWTLPLAAAVAGQMAYTAANSLTGSMAASVVVADSARFFPRTTAGMALGALVAGWAAAGAPPWAAAPAAAALVGAQLAEPWLLSRSAFPGLHSPPLREVLRSVWGPALVALVAWGPLLVYSALVVQAASPAWVGPAMVAYAAGGLAAGRLDAAVRRGRGWPGVLVLAAAGVGTWVLAATPVLLVAGRFASGALLFTAQARIYRLVVGDGPEVSQAKVAAVSAGLGLGCGAGALVSARVAAATSVPAMGAALGAATLALAGAVGLYSSARRAPVVGPAEPAAR